MCGIFGFFSRNGKITSDEVRAASEALHHRGPDNAGAVFFEAGKAMRYPAGSIPDGEWSSVLAHTRLSIIDLSRAADQPMSNEDGSLWIVYNGEIYNFREIMADLKARGHTFISRSDTEVIIHGYEEWGTDVVCRLRGMFAFALLDQRRGRLIVVRDRLGVKPVKYFSGGGRFVFASELKGILHLVPRTPDTASLNRFLTLKYIPSPGTILEGVRKVSPGEMLVYDVDSGKLETSIYWKPAFYPKSRFSFEEAKEGFTQLLSQSVNIRTISDVPVGVYLSGGMDSSAIVSFLRHNGMEDIKTFTIKFDRQGYDESEYARTVSRLFQTSHHEFAIPSLSYDDVRKIISSLDEPFGDPSYIPTYFLSGFTSGHVKVVLSGDGGDELLGGYKRYFIHARGRVLDLLPRLNTGFIKKLPPEINKRTFTGKVQRIAEDISAGYWGAYLLRFNGMSDSFRRYVMTPDMYRAAGGLSMEGLLGDLSDFSNIRDTIERFIWIDLQTYLPDYILAKTDLALMAHSVEGRNPFVDYKLVEFSNMLPPAYKFKNGGKHILKSILSEYLPHELIHRKKMGFSPPIKYWFRENAGLLYEIFSERDFVSKDIFELKKIHQLIERFRDTEMNISEQLWLIIVLELWRREYKV